MARQTVHAVLPWVVLLATLTAFAPDAFPAPQNRAEALAGLRDKAAERRAEAVVWIASHGDLRDQPLLLERLRGDESPFVRDFAEQGLWLLWSRSGDRDIDAAMARGVEQMQAGHYDDSIATFSDVIRRRPDFAEGWNKRATARFLAGRYRESLADCDEVVKRNPEHFGALAGYGQIYYRLEQYEQAIRYWRRALEVNPNLPGVEIRIKDAERRLGAQRRRSI